MTNSARAKVTATPLFDSIRLAVFAAILGAVVAYAALAFLLLIEALTTLFFGHSDTSFYMMLAELPPWRVVLAPTVGGLLVGLFVWRWMPERKNYGPADVMEAVQEHDGNVNLKTGLGSALVSAVSIGAGASLGRYGPAVYLGAAISSWLGRLLKLERGQRIALVGSGVAAAIAASFNAPLGGILFATEVMLGGRALRSFVPVTVAAVVGTAIARTHGNDFHISDLSVHSIVNLHEYVMFAATGTAGGLLAVALMKSMSLSIRWVNNTGLPVWIRPMIGGLLLGLIGTQFPHVLGLGDEVIWDSYAGAFPVGLLLGLLALKLIATSLSIGFGFSGGVFGPSLFVGAMFGSAVGLVLFALLPDFASAPAIYALVGMAAVVSCVIGAPVATILIAFELTSSYPLATAVMISVVCAHLVSRRVFAHSHFTNQLAARGVDVEIRREVQILRGMAVSNVLSAQYQALDASTLIDEAIERCLREPDQELLVVDADGALLGGVSVYSLISAQKSGAGAGTVMDVAEMPDLVLQANTNLHQALLDLRDFVGVSIPVISDAQSRRVIGVILENAVINAYNEAVDQARDEERGLR